MTINPHVYPFSRRTVTTFERLSKRDLISIWRLFSIDRKNIYSKKVFFKMTVLLTVVPRSRKIDTNRGRLFLGPRDSSCKKCQTFASLSPLFKAYLCHYRGNFGHRPQLGGRHSHLPSMSYNCHEGCHMPYFYCHEDLNHCHSKMSELANGSEVHPLA